MYEDDVRAALKEMFGASFVVRHRRNHTGAAKLSFEARSSRQHLWVKVAANDEEDAALETWASMAEVLASTHHAPPLQAVVKIVNRTALVFAYIDAPVASRDTIRSVYSDLQSVLARLHSDDDLAGQLGGPSTSASSFRNVWLRRFEEDLLITAGHIPELIHDYVATELELMAYLINNLDEYVSAAIHADPWYENILLGHKRIWLLDWEKLSIGDPVIDEAIVLMDAYGPFTDRWTSSHRLEVARRALMLDAVIDTAADMVQAVGEPTRSSKTKAYLAAFDAYRAIFAV